MRAVLVMLLVLGMVPALLQAQGGASAAAAGEGQPAEQAGTENNFVVQRESVPEKAAPAKTPKVVYNPQKRRDPTLSPDDVLILEDRARKLRIAQEQERKRREAAEKAERERQERLPGAQPRHVRGHARPRNPEGEHGKLLPRRRDRMLKSTTDLPIGTAVGILDQNGTGRKPHVQHRTT